MKNTTKTTKTLTGWTLHDSSSHRCTFPKFALKAGKTVKVHTGTGRNTGSSLYWRQAYYVWNNSGDTATLRNAHGATVDRCAYTSSEDPEARC